MPLADGGANKVYVGSSLMSYVVSIIVLSLYHVSIV